MKNLCKLLIACFFFTASAYAQDQYISICSFNIAELGVGLNPKCRMLGIMLEDEGVLGTAHIGIGTNITLGGNIKAPCHYDLLVWRPRIEVDGGLVIEGAVLHA